MKKVWLYACILLILSSCSQNQPEELRENSQEENSVHPDESTVKIEKMHIDTNNFHFVADWLSNTEIVYTGRENDTYYVEIFEMKTGESKIIYEDAAIIVDVFIHPTKELLLIHTTDSPTSAQIKMISLDGTLINEFSIASSEVEINWNDLNPALVLLTAFKEDWTYTNYIYNGENDDLSPISLPDPFSKWLGSDKIVAVDNEALVLFDLETKQIEPTSNDDIIYFDTYKDYLLTVQLEDGSNEVYSIMDEEEEVHATWTASKTAFMTNGIFPEINWVSNNSILMAAPLNDGQLDGLDSFKLISIVNNHEELVAEDLETTSLRCSPDASRCLIGYGYEKVIDLETKEVVDWIVFKE